MDEKTYTYDHEQNVFVEYIFLVGETKYTVDEIVDVLNSLSELAQSQAETIEKLEYDMDSANEEIADLQQQIDEMGD